MERCKEAEKRERLEEVTLSETGMLSTYSTPPHPKPKKSINITIAGLFVVNTSLLSYTLDTCG